MSNWKDCEDYGKKIDIISKTLKILFQTTLPKQNKFLATWYYKKMKRENKIF